MNALRARIERIEEAIGRADAMTEHERSTILAKQLEDLSDAELDRLEAILLHLGVIDEDESRSVVLIPDDYTHIRDLIVLVDADPEAYFAAARDLR
ncbi:MULTISPECIES: hypothetical protein [unclassified Mesorhizobium]|uniref:hypothetical protein n=1 Tax=unclassified Mesorhizobium TaxID=325217 RepID=UPI00112D6932|nr:MULTISPECIES: hypothetical protein [unclassified Mesorhizobium]TPK42633.1 hypothetical protein FJ550_29705 [Mesorhizobium sp. B2-5-2]TPL26753.1 hypothetical protein FJ946_13025 [Mesorhizobium sp. B2-4-7]TPL40531.1 hypothetical protein FJ961_17325 [Mesorhizobium sp. B2-4-5]TPM76805.1 hypothetical protein FJ968_03555 [Mesorhizobium sp. B2-1-6]TPN72468.1 hypothetical protein FJ985_29210 [Mesorhizobium sp. B1-1-2]